MAKPTMMEVGDLVRVTLKTAPGTPAEEFDGKVMAYDPDPSKPLLMILQLEDGTERKILKSEVEDCVLISLQESEEEILPAVPGTLAAIISGPRKLVQRMASGCRAFGRKVKAVVQRPEVRVMAYASIIVCVALLSVFLYYQYLEKSISTTPEAAATKKVFLAPLLTRSKIEPLPTTEVAVGLTDPDRTAAMAAAAHEGVEDLKEQVDELRKSPLVPIVATIQQPPAPPTTLTVGSAQWINDCVEFGGTEPGCQKRLRLLRR